MLQVARGFGGADRELPAVACGLTRPVTGSPAGPGSAPDLPGPTVLGADTASDAQLAAAAAVLGEAVPVALTPAAPIPEPASLALLGTGLASAASLLGSRSSPSGRGIALFRSRPFVPRGGEKDQEDADTALVTGRTLVIDDSFFSRAEGHLAPYFSNLKVMHFADFLTAVRDGDLPHFDRIVIETVQRGWPERSAWLEPGHPVHEALAAELARPRSEATGG